ncbi:MAG: replication-associated recombination protein A [Gaiellaceae bacterium]
MADLFSEAARERQAGNAPLAVRLRPSTLDELVGQQHVLGHGSALRLAIEHDRPPSMILFGPPGTGKTTIARIVAERTGAAFEELSAVSARVDDVRAVIARAGDRLGGNGLRTILFIDEIHRFNKAQQDSVLHAVEDGLVTLIGATTENPYFEVNSALLSRCTVIELTALAEAELVEILRRGAAVLDTEASPELLALLASRAGGDARAALQILELAAATAEAESAALTEEHVLDASRKRPLLYDRKGDQHYDFASAFIKSMRGGDADASIYYLAAMLEAGEDPRFIARRMVILASEDVGNADPNALVVAVAAAQALEHVGLPEAQLNLAQAAIYLARAPKSNASAVAIWEARRDVRDQGNARPPAMLRSTGHKAGAKARGHGEGYAYPHDDPTGFGLSYLPEELRSDTVGGSRGRYYRPANPLEGVDLTDVVDYLRDACEPGAAEKLEALDRSRRDRKE